MGSLGPETIGDEIERPITVLVTGFGPFQEKYPVNPSFEIARSLPSVLLKPTAPGRSRPIHIIRYGSPIRVCYDDARALIPPLLEAYSKTVDLILHIGMASGRDFYTAERYAHREGYTKHKDLDGRVPPLDEPEVLFGDCPPLVETGFHFDNVMRRWQAAVLSSPTTSPAHGADCRPSDNAGYYLCDYTYLNSLVWYGRRNGRLDGGTGKDRPVMFLHVPAESDQISLDRGAAVAIALIQAMADDFIGMRQM